MRNAVMAILITALLITANGCGKRPAGPEGKGLPDLASFRAAQPRLSWSLSDLIASDRDDRV